MPNLADKLITLKIKEFDIKRRILSKKTSCVFLREDGELAPYAETHTPSGGWLLDYSNYLQMPILFYATADASFYLTLEKSGFAAIDGLIYEIQKPSCAPPDGKRPFFRIPLLLSGKTYTP